MRCRVWYTIVLTIDGRDHRQKYTSDLAFNRESHLVLQMKHDRRHERLNEHWRLFCPIKFDIRLGSFFPALFDNPCFFDLNQRDWKEILVTSHRRLAATARSSRGELK
jgi:hypothetical protein